MSSSREIQTERLRLEPQHPRSLLALIESTERFEEVAGVRAAPGLRDFLVSGEVSSDYLDALRAAESADPWVHGFAAIHRDTGVMIGMGGYKGEPDAEGVAEIAYGVAPSYESQGYATEIAAGLSRFASADPRVRLLRAHTLPEKNASTQVLAKIGFAFVGQVVDPEDGPVWRWERGRFEEV